MESPSDAMDNQSIIGMIKPQNFLLQECSDLVYYLDHSHDGGDIPHSFTKLLTEEANSISPSLSCTGYGSREFKSTAIDHGSVDRSVVDLTSPNATVTHQLRAGETQVIGHCNNPIRAEQKTVATLPDDVAATMAHEEQRKRKNEGDEPPSPSSSSQMQSRKKLRLYEIETPFQDEKKERRRRNAQNSRNYRLLLKKRKSDLEKEIAGMKGVNKQLQQELERLQLRVTEYTLLIQFYQRK